MKTVKMADVLIGERFRVQGLLCERVQSEYDWVPTSRFVHHDGTLQGEVMFSFKQDVQVDEESDKRYFLDTDGDSHWYVVPCDNAEEWFRWRNLPDCEEAWQVPDFAESVGGSYNRVSFTHPIIS